MKVIFNGELLEIQDTPASDKGWLPGQGIFETVKTVENAVYALDLHLDRAQKSARAISLKIPDRNEIEQAVDMLLKHVRESNGLLRISFAEHSDWLVVHLPYESSDAPLKLRIHPQKFSGSPYKQFPYTDRLKVMEQSKSAGFDDAIIVNTRGDICEGSVTNLMVHIENQWLTPPVEDGLLPGIMREILIANNLVKVQSIQLSQISNITSAFFLSSLRIAQPIASIEAYQLQVSHVFGQEIHALARKYSVG